MQIQIRPAMAEDLPSVYAFICDLEEITFDFECFSEGYLQNIAGKNNIYLVAEVDNHKVAGFLSCHGQYLLHHCGMVWEIQEMYVDSRHRGRGIGRQLITAIETCLRDRECLSLEVASNARRLATHEFYISCGFQKSHFRFTKELETSPGRK